MTPPVPIKVMHVITGLELGGAESMLYALATAPAAAGLRQSVVSLTADGHFGPLLREAGVEVAVLGMRRGMPTPGAVRALARLIKAKKPDVVQGWMYHADLMALLALAWSGRRRRTKLCWGLRASNLHGPGFGLRFRAVRRLWILLSRCPDLVIANSQAGIGAHVALGMRARNIRAIANGIDTVRFRPSAEVRARMRYKLGVEPSVRLLAHVARLDPIKDHAGFIAAMDRLPQARAILVGGGTETLPRRANVTSLGQRDDVPDLLAGADIVVSSSLSEGFSNVLAEGMAAGLPAVATDVGDARAILGDTGVLCPPRDPAALAAAVETLLDEPEASFRRRAAAARQRIVENFSLDRATEAFTLAYRGLLAGSPPDGHG
jgi:glycosyltransferase involved in cell wall biosynthesis